MMIFAKSLMSGVAAVIAMWVAIVVFWSVWRFYVLKKQFPDEVVSVAGGYDMLIHTPLVWTLLTLAFWLGLYLFIRKH